MQSGINWVKLENFSLRLTFFVKQISFNLLMKILHYMCVRVCLKIIKEVSQ